MARLKTIDTKKHQRKVYSVSELNTRAKQVLEQSLFQVWVEAEISNLTMASSGHWYFTLKDSKSQVSCAMFKGNNQRTQVKPSEGIKVLVKGKISLYEPRGNYQLIVDDMEHAGVGDLLQQYEQLKAKLEVEGLFNSERKQPIEQSYSRIGVITSPTGAAIHDIISTVRRRYPLQQLVLYPSVVQGAQAATSIRHQIEVANQRNEVDILLLARGGGSIEDLWCFNDEALARTIAASALPIVSGVGHEVDFTIADFVADLRAATPTAAAEKTTPDQRELLQHISAVKRWMKDDMTGSLQAYQQQLDWYQRQLKTPDTIISKHRQQLRIHCGQLASSFLINIRSQSDCLQGLRLKLQQQEPLKLIQSATQKSIQLKQQLLYNQTNLIQLQQARLATLAGKLDSLSPLKVLSRGYSVTLDEQDAVIHDSSQIQEGAKIKTRLGTGELISTVQKIITEDQ